MSGTSAGVIGRNPRSSKSRSWSSNPAIASNKMWKDSADEVAAGDAVSELPRGNRRYVTALLCLCVSTICYADRTNMGIALPALVVDKKEQGEVLSAFFYGYMCTQILGGYFAARFGAKIVLITGVVVWTLFDLSTVVVAKCLTCLFFTRAGMGLGEGILFPCMHQIASAWYPIQERSRLVTLVASGSDLGTISALVISPAIMAASGWQRIFVTFGVFSFIWVVVYVFEGASRPEVDPRITVEERTFILRNRVVNHDTTHQRRAELDTHALNWRVLLTSRPAWAIYVAHMCYNYSWYILLGWIPQYFSQVLNLDLTKNGGFAAALPYICGYMGTLLFGRLGDVLLTCGYRALHVRQGMNAFSFLGCAFFLFLLRFANSALVAVALLCMTLFTGRAAMAGYWVNMIDVAPNHAAHIMGVSNTFGTIPGIIGNMVTGAILQATGSWDLVFAVAALVLVFGAMFFHCCASDESIYAQPRYDEGYNGSSTTSSSFRGSPSFSLPRLSILDEEESLLETQI